MVSRKDVQGTFEFPVLKPEDLIPNELIGFNYANRTNRYDATVHFCIDDYQFERVWKKPQTYTKLLRKFHSVITPDFSIYDDMPFPMRLWNLYRAFALGKYFQDEGINVIPNITANDETFLKITAPYYPKNSTVFFSTVGITRDKECASVAKKQFELIEHLIKPKRILIFGNPLNYEWSCEMINFEARKWNE